MDTNTKICERCGKELPLDRFRKLTFGVTKMCSKCIAEKSAEGRKKNRDVANVEVLVKEAKTARLHDFTPRELMEELHSRGYTGVLEYTEIHKIDITKL